jgi:hypothetical protein
MFVTRCFFVDEPSVLVVSGLLWVVMVLLHVLLRLCLLLISRSQAFPRQKLCFYFIEIHFIVFNYLYLFSPFIRVVET